MTIRGGGNPNPAMAAMPLREWTRRLGKIEGPAWREAQGQSAYSQRYFLGFARRRTVARSSRTIRAYTTAYNRFNRWCKAGIWDGMMDAIVKAHDGKVQMIDSSIVRVHQHASGPKKEWRSLCGPKPRRHHHKDPHARRRERPSGLPPDLAGEAHDASCADALPNGLENGAV